jgi:DNA invertase Pin-like site-specific DNA recombinase
MSNRILYAYERFSTPEQAAGDSIRRQTEKAAAYAKQHGLVLDDTFELHDHGISAFRGRNFAQGALGRFLKAVDEGVVPRGSMLGAENIDRVSRECPWDAQHLVREITDRDITLVTFDDGKIYSQETLRNDATLSILLTVYAMRAHDESKKKAERLKAAWVGKRQRMGDKILTSRAPGWLRVKGGKFEAIPERAAVVRRIFEMAADGTGLESIARTFNREGVATFGKARQWHRSYVAKVIESRAVVGTFIPHTVDYQRDGREIGKSKRIRRPAQPIENYFPKVVRDDLYQRVRAMRGGHRAPATRTTTIRNVLASLAVCSVCGSTMTRVSKGARKRAGKPYLVCSRAKVGAGCKYVAHPLVPIEAAVKTGIPYINHSLGFYRQVKVKELKAIEAQIQKAMNLLLVTNRPPVSLREKLSALEDHRKQLREDFIDLPDPRVMTANIQRLKNLKEWNPTEVNALLRQIFARFVVKEDRLVAKFKDDNPDIIMWIE